MEEVLPVYFINFLSNIDFPCSRNQSVGWHRESEVALWSLKIDLIGFINNIYLKEVCKMIIFKKITKSDAVVQWFAL